MIKGLYTITRGMVAFEKGQEVIANNLANLDTVGFKEQQSVYQSFPEMLKLKLDETGATPIGTVGSGSKVAATYTNFQSGSLQQSNNHLDLAIQGPGFIAVQTPQGVMYTRSGNFTLNQIGQLVTTDGYQVLGNNGPIQTFGQPFTVDENGVVRIDGGVTAQINIVDFADLNQLERVGSSLYNAPEGLEQVNVTGIIRQGYLERSNVNVIHGMTQMITAARLYEISQKTIQSQDETLSKAVNEVGRVSG